MEKSIRVEKFQNDREMFLLVYYFSSLIKDMKIADKVHVPGQIYSIINIFNELCIAGLPSIVSIRLIIKK